jgi:hypothetical protein
MKGLNEDDKKLADSVVATVLDYTNLSYDDFVYRRSLRTAVSARRVVSLILRDYGWSYPKIGEAIQKDHASVYNLVNRASDNVVAEAHNLKDRILHGHKPVYNPPPDHSWRDNAACKDTPTEVFFNVKYKNEALALCQKCPVQSQCLTYRFETLNAPDEDAGIWGGTTRAERSRMF